MNQPNPIQRLTSEAHKEALLAQRKHMVEVQRQKVERLTEQVSDRLLTFQNLLYDVRNRPAQFPYGAIGKDGETIDDLLKVLAHEAESLHDMEAAERSTDDLAAKYQALIDEAQGPEVAEPGQVISMGGQYL